MKKKIIISVSNDIGADQRLQKLARTLFENDFDLLLVGREFKNSLPLDLPYPTKRMRLIFNKKAISYAEFNIRLFFLLINLKSDIYLSCRTDTLPANYYASKIKKTRLIFEAREIFPEMLEFKRRPFAKKVWTKIEKSIFPKLHNTFTVSQSIADYYRKLYRTRMNVVRNVPYFEIIADGKGKFNIAGKKIIIYQGAVSEGCGLERVIDAMPFVSKDAVLMIIGDGDLKRNLIQSVVNKNLTNRIMFLEKKCSEELFRYTKAASIGLCLPENLGLSNCYALPEQIFEYLRAGVPVLASDLPEINEFVNTCKTGIVIDNCQPQLLADTINGMFAEKMETVRFDSIARKNCWEVEQTTLLKIVRGRL
ncbi:MAG: glycosyltransferase [Prevotellaceae bacterium]|jgi:glycosyltransferase involved in cell wall biosynthesis|nr:glycosyltransferase [Prevotellaceae bacterium]